MIVIASHTVPDNIEKVRLLDYTLGLFAELPTRNSIKKAIKRGELLLNGKVSESGIFLYTSDKIEVVELVQKELRIFELKLGVLFEDDYLAVIHKPAGIGVSGNYFRTIQNALPFNLKSSIQKDAFQIARPVHRLDNPTSGLLLIAKTKNAAVKLGEMLAQKQIEKNYYAIVIGCPKGSGVIDSPIEGKIAISKYEVIKTIPSNRFESLSLVKLSPLTGRTHQLRIHMAHINCPILGDKEYGADRKNLWGKGLFLSAVELRFSHPITSEIIDVKVDTPRKFKMILPH